MGTVDTNQLLAERQKTHGEYGEHARCTQEIIRVLQAERGYPTLTDMQKESLHMIAHKMGRIVTGNPNIEDHWDDIAGYAVLISQRLRSPVMVFDHANDIAGALAMAWNCTRSEAIERHAKLIQVMREKKAASEKPFEIPEQQQFEAVVDAVVVDLKAEVPEPVPSFLGKRKALD